MNKQRMLGSEALVETLAAAGEPCVIEALVQGGEQVLAEPFRRDALRKARRHLPRYRHLDVD